MCVKGTVKNMFEAVIRFVEAVIMGSYELAPVYICVEEE